MSYPLPPPNQGYHPGVSMGPPPPPEAFANGGSMPGPGKSLEQAHSENLIKYRKLKAKYFELENRWKDAMAQLERSRQQNVRLKDEKSGFLDRVVELEAIIAHNAANGAPPVTSSAFPRNFVYPRQPMSGSLPPDYSSLAKVLDEDDDEDPRKSSKHVGNALKRREEEEEQRRHDEERQRRVVKRPRVSKGFTTTPTQPPGGEHYQGYGHPGNPDDMYGGQPPPAPSASGPGGIYPNHQS